MHRSHLPLGRPGSLAVHIPHQPLERHLRPAGCRRSWGWGSYKDPPGCFCRKLGDRAIGPIPRPQLASEGVGPRSTETEMPVAPQRTSRPLAAGTQPDRGKMFVPPARVGISRSERQAPPHSPSPPFPDFSAADLEAPSSPRRWAASPAAPRRSPRRPGPGYIGPSPDHVPTRTAEDGRAAWPPTSLLKVDARVFSNLKEIGERGDLPRPCADRAPGRPRPISDE